MCLADAGFGQTYALHKTRPAYVRARDLTPARADMFGDASAEADAGLLVPEPTGLARVEIRGPIETRAGYHDECGGWSTGYDEIAERMIAALADADVLLVVDSPGGAVMGIVECVAAVLAAKATHGRRVYVVCASGMVASAAFWLACAFADAGEFYLTAGSMAGSIGARSAHVSEEGALSMAGLAWTDFAYPAGKVALSPARALSATGKARGERDVMAAFDAFQGAVTTARPWLTRKAIVKLDADMLTGAAAVAAGLADSVATIEEVEAWALSRANGEAMPEEEKDPAAEDMPPAEPDAAADEDKTAKCEKCDAALEPADKFCSECGEKQDGAPDEELAANAEDSKMPPADASVAALLGLRPGASDVAIKMAAREMRVERDHVRKIVGSDSFEATRGGLAALAQDARRGARAAADLKVERGANEKRERVTLLTSLAKANLPGFPRGDLLRDVANAAGTAIVDTVPAAFYAKTPIAELRSFVGGKLKNAAPSAERTPFEPSEANAKPSAKTTAKSDDLANKNGLKSASVAEAESFINAQLGAAS
jgi:ClpP class serine protease